MRFRGVLAVEGQATNDGRLIERGALIWPADEPIPVHLGFGGPIIGRAEKIERCGDEIVCEIELPDRAEGTFGLAVGITVDAGNIESSARLVRVTSGRITHATTTDDPVFPEAWPIEGVEDAWRRVGDAVKALADEDDIVRHAVALRARVVDAGGNEDDVALSASLSALVVREFDALAGAAQDEPASVVVRFVLPRGWWSER